MYKVIGNDQRIYGPASLAQVRQWQAEGRVNNASLAQVEGSADWKPLSAFPEFGIPPIVVMPARVEQHGNGMAIAGLVCGILANICCCFGFIFAILGIVFSIIALNRHEGGTERGSNTIAVCGLVLSALGLVWPALYGLLTPGHWFWMHHHWRRW